MPFALLIIGLAVSGVLLWAKDSRGDPAHLTVSGTIECESIRLGSKVGGRLKEVLVEEGDPVTPGMPVATFEVPELYAQMDQLVAARNEAEAVSKKLQNGPREVEIAVARAAVDSALASYAELAAGSREEDEAAAEAAWRQAEANLLLAQKEYARAEQLFDQNVIARNQLDSSLARVETMQEAASAARQQFEKLKAGPRTTQLEVAAAQIKQAESALRATRAGSRVEDIEASLARLAGIEAQIAQLKVRLDEATVRVPSKGVVSSLLGRTGDLLAPGSPVLEMLLSESCFIQVFVPADKLSWVRPGTEAKVYVDSYPGQSYSGTVTFVASKGEFTPRNLQTKENRVEEVFRCKVKLDSDNNELLPGMVCDVIFSRPALVNQE